MPNPPPDRRHDHALRATVAEADTLIRTGISTPHSVAQALARAHRPLPVALRIVGRAALARTRQRGITPYATLLAH